LKKQLASEVVARRMAEDKSFEKNDDDAAVLSAVTT
jgi:hypothetical protein